MSLYSDALDAVVTQAETAIGVSATRDPALVGSIVAAEGGCVFVQFPTHVGRLLAGPNLEVPVSLVGSAPADLQSVDWLLEHMDALIDFAGARSVTNGPLDIGSNTYPAVTATAQVALEVPAQAPPATHGNPHGGPPGQSGTVPPGPPNP